MGLRHIAPAQMSPNQGLNGALPQGLGIDGGGRGINCLADATLFQQGHRQRIEGVQAQLAKSGAFDDNPVIVPGRQQVIEQLILPGLP